MNISRGWILTAAVLVGCGDNNERPRVDAAVDATVQSAEERGQYIMNVLGACTFCHTPLLPNGMRDLENLLAGVDCFVDIAPPAGNGQGCLSTRNLTNHETGLKNATDKQIKDAFQHGIRTDGKKIFPIMPYWVFHNMTDADADAVVAYLRTVPGIDHQVKANEVPFSLYNDGLPSGFNYVPPLTLTEIPMPRGGDNNESAMRGRYLTSMAGLCIDCHTPDVAPFAIQLDTTKPFGGGRVFPKEQLGLVDTAGTAYPANIATRNLTPDATGLMGWSREQIKKAIKDGSDKDGNGVCAATHGGATSPYAALEQQDLDDIAEYLFNLEPVANDTTVLNCGLPPVPFPVGPPETGLDCNNGDDDDGDTVADDGCYVACGNCEGPAVP